ncbi:MAG TPA: SMP-30/gluconolactonase/LRE family protein [Streptosporangiaceae bacterium]
MGGRRAGGPVSHSKLSGLRRRRAPVCVGQPRVRQTGAGGVPVPARRRRRALVRRGRDFRQRPVPVPDGRHLYVAETFAHRVFRIPINADGTAGSREDVADLGAALPDGLAFDAAGNLYVGCYEPSQVLRVDPAGRVATLFHDVTAHTLAHPTNLAFRGATMFTANLGRWHITAIEVGITGPRGNRPDRA